MRWPSRIFVAAALSGAPSTLHALMTGRDPLAATRAAATLLPGRKTAPAHPPPHQEFARGTPLISRYQEGLTILAGAAVHLGISVFWAAVIDAVDDRRHVAMSRRNHRSQADAVAMASMRQPSPAGEANPGRAPGIAGGAAEPRRSPEPVGGEAKPEDGPGVNNAAEPRRGLGPVGGAVAGLMIAILDLEIIGRRYPAIRTLPKIPQYLDHIAFGVLVTSLRGPGGSAASASNPTAPSTFGRRPR